MMTFHIKESATGKEIKRSRDVYESIKEIGQADQESIWVIGYNAANREIFRKCLFLGGIYDNIADPLIIFKRLLLCGATSWAMIHNHPSGTLYPSKHDLTTTKALYQASNILNLTMLDHIIIGDEGYYSFADNLWPGCQKPIVCSETQPSRATFADPKERLSSRLWWYKTQVKSILHKRRRLKNPVGKRGPLKQTTLYQYRLTVNRWPKERKVLKAEIRELRATIKASVAQAAAEPKNFKGGGLNGMYQETTQPMGHRLL